MTISTIFIVLVLALSISIVLRFISLGMNFEEAFISLLKFPFDIPKLHFNLFKAVKNEDQIRAIKLLFMPVFDLPQVIIGYAEMRIKSKATILAIVELIQETDEKDFDKLSIALQKNGIRIQRKKLKNEKKNSNNNQTLENISELIPQFNSYSDNFDHKFS